MPAYITVTADVEVSIDEFDDDDLVAEVRRRELIPKLLATLDAKKTAKAIDVEELAGSIMRWLMARRHEYAAAEMDDLFAALIPRELREADQAIRDRRYGDAICRLDQLINPSPAATATSLPLRGNAQRTEAASP